jgi:hypothetical protein
MHRVGKDYFDGMSERERTVLVRKELGRLNAEAPLNCAHMAPTYENAGQSVVQRVGKDYFGRISEQKRTVLVRKELRRLNAEAALRPTAGRPVAPWSHRATVGR